MKRKIKVGTRDSKLAMIQTQMVIDSIIENNPDIEIEIVSLKTTGDKILDRALDKIGGKGLFVKELDEALLSGEVDFTVHSFKDMPMEINENLPIVALSERADFRDVYILPKGHSNTEAPIGCGSKRRIVQLKSIFKDKEIAPIRGNVITRLEKLDRGEYSAIVLAAAGIKRLGLDERINRYFETEEILPSACQGIIAVQGRKGENYDYLKYFNSPESQIIAEAERSFVKELDGGCSAPIAAFATVEENKVKLKGMYYNEETEKLVKEEIIGDISEAENMGIELAKKVKMR
ncbi:hydroxymethylbilane synthase [Clostridium cadaveris]|uniref:hydroxymethylbilane synthase n=1 Tax=Clostridium cadaveris TaxID=1529 RepID=UPI00311AA333